VSGRQQVRNNEKCGHILLRSLNHISISLRIPGISRADPSMLAITLRR